MHCNVCFAQLDEPLYESSSRRALTSLCELTQEKVKVWLCPNCSHLRGNQLPHTQDYYEKDYRILLDEDDEDQIYEVKDEGIVYRTDHQVLTFLNKINVKGGSRFLDYGCAKASMSRRLLEHEPDIEFYLFDVSSMYLSYWEKFLTQERWAIYELPATWYLNFDIVTSFFALEHIPEPLDTALEIANLLVEDGVFYGVVPNVFSNLADLVVVDHVNHFTEASLHFLLSKAGFCSIDIDANAHRGALVFTARKKGLVSPSPEIDECKETSRKIASYWSDVDSRIRLAEVDNFAQPAAIYGSGFYGAYIASTLKNPEFLKCFVDASPFQQGKTLFNYPVLSPQEIPSNIRVLYMGLNPIIAREIVSNMAWLHERDISLVFLDEGA